MGPSWPSSHFCSEMHKNAYCSPLFFNRSRGKYELRDLQPSHVYGCTKAKAPTPLGFLSPFISSSSSSLICLGLLCVLLSSPSDAAYEQSLQYLQHPLRNTDNSQIYICFSKVSSGCQTCKCNHLLNTNTSSPKNIQLNQIFSQISSFFCVFYFKW